MFTLLDLIRQSYSLSPFPQVISSRFFFSLLTHSSFSLIKKPKHCTRFHIIKNYGLEIKWNKISFHRNNNEKIMKIWKFADFGGKKTERKWRRKHIPLSVPPSSMCANICWFTLNFHGGIKTHLHCKYYIENEQINHICSLLSIWTGKNRTFFVIVEEIRLPTWRASKDEKYATSGFEGWLWETFFIL